MPKKQKSGSQNDKFPNVKPFETGLRGGFENKEKFPLWAYPETLEAVEQSYRGDRLTAFKPMSMKAKFSKGRLGLKRL